MLVSDGISLEVGMQMLLCLHCVRMKRVDWCQLKDLLSLECLPS